MKLTDMEVKVEQSLQISKYEFIKPAIVIHVELDETDDPDDIYKKMSNFAWELFRSEIRKHIVSVRETKTKKEVTK